jgi:hypothetical protein
MAGFEVIIYGRFWVIAEVENVFGAAERWLSVDDPVLPEQLPEEVAECAR